MRGAARQLDQWHEWAAMDHQETTRARCQALLAAIQGLPEETERRAALAFAAAVAADQDLAGLRWDQLEILRARGIAALLAQQPERAAEALGSVWEHTRREGVDDPGAFPVAPDLVEALVRLGRSHRRLARKPQRAATRSAHFLRFSVMAPATRPAYGRAKGAATNWARQPGSGWKPC